MDALTAIAERQGVLHFRPDPLASDEIEALLQAAASAPSPVNLQPWAFVVVTQRDLCAQVARYLMTVQEARVFGDLLELPAAYTERLMTLYEGFEQTPCFIFVCLEPKVEFARPEHAGVLREWHLVCLGAAMQNLMVAATAMGLGTRWFGGFALDAGGATLKPLLGIPPHIEIVACSPVGRHDARPKPRPVQARTTLAEFARGDSRALGRLLRGRLPLDAVVHYQHW